MCLFLSAFPFAASSICDSLEVLATMPHPPSPVEAVCRVDGAHGLLRES